MIDADRPRCILVDGLDLAGKSMACAALVAGLAPAPEHRRNALTPGNPIYQAADAVRRAGSLPGEYLAHAYLAALALDLCRYQPPIRLTIQESLLGTRSVAHYRARGDEAVARRFAALLDDPRHPRFDAAVVLTASLPVRRARLQMRRRDAPHEIADDDLIVFTAPDLFQHMEQVLIDEACRRFGAVVIDTSERRPDEVVTLLRQVVLTGDRRRGAA